MPPDNSRLRTVTVLAMLSILAMVTSELGTLATAAIESLNNTCLLSSNSDSSIGIDTAIVTTKALCGTGVVDGNVVASGNGVFVASGTGV